ncbi:MAG: hypothetical protein ACFFCS_03875 [Candidatus Hodarchaeota archaeon]
MGRNIKDKKNRNELITLSIVIVGMLLLPLFYFLPTSLKIAGGKFEKRVCAFYYMWYGNSTVYPNEHPNYDDRWLHWGAHDVGNFDFASAHSPSLLTNDTILYDSSDGDTIDFHLQIASDSGINTFITSWWATRMAGWDGWHDVNFEILLNRTLALGMDMQHTVYFETNQEKYSRENSQGVQNMYNDLKYIVDSYANHPKFLKIYDSTTETYRPVIFVYATTSKPSVENWTTVVDYLHGNGSNPFLVADVGVGTIPEDLTDLFDGFHTYNPLGLFRDDPGNALSKYEELVLSSRINGKLSCATTLPGYNDTVIRDPGQYLERKSGQTYEFSWDVCTKSGADWILICTFNEWHEGTDIEPSLDYGSFYMNKTKRFSSIFNS